MEGKLEKATQRKYSSPKFSVDTMETGKTLFTGKGSQIDLESSEEKYTRVIPLEMMLPENHEFIHDLFGNLWRDDVLKNNFTERQGVSSSNETLKVSHNKAERHRIVGESMSELTREEHEAKLEAAEERQRSLLKDFRNDTDKQFHDLSGKLDNLTRLIEKTHEVNAVQFEAVKHDISGTKTVAQEAKDEAVKATAAARSTRWNFIGAVIAIIAIIIAIWGLNQATISSISSLSSLLNTSQQTSSAPPTATTKP